MLLFLLKLGRYEHEIRKSTKRKCTKRKIMLVSVSGLGLFCRFSGENHGRRFFIRARA